MTKRLGWASILARAVGREAARILHERHKDLANTIVYKRARENYLAQIKPAHYDSAKDTIEAGLNLRGKKGKRTSIVEHGQRPWYMAARASFTGNGPRALALEQKNGSYNYPRWISRKSDGWKHPGVSGKAFLQQLKRETSAAVKEAMINILRGTASKAALAGKRLALKAKIREGAEKARGK